MLACRKCGTPNPETNDYCRRCGAALAVSTAMVRAQRSLFLPADRGIGWRWIGLGALAILGLAALFLAGLVLMVGLGATTGGEPGTGPLADRLRALPIAAAGLFLGAFLLGGIIVAWMSRGRTVLEPVLSALVVLALLGAVGSVLTLDAIWMTAVAALPCALMAGIGGWVGELFDGRGSGR